MASIAKRPDGRWRARYRDDAGKEHARHFSRKFDAQRWLDEVTTAVVTGTYVDPSAGKITFSRFYADWSVRQLWVASTRDNADRTIKAVPFGDLPMKTIRRSHVEAWVKSMSVDGLAATTIKTKFVILRSVFRAAVKDKVIAADPADGVVLPRARKPEAAMRVPNVEEVGRLLACADSGRVSSRKGFRPYVALCAFAGLRLGEASGLQVTDIDFLRRELKVSRQIQRDGRGYMVAPPKYGSERVVSLPDELLALLSEHVKSLTDETPEPWLFSIDGLPMHDNAVTWRWRATRKSAGLEWVRLHDLRHFYASGLIADGCSVVTVQRALGHATATTTLSTYAHLWPTAGDQTRKAAAGLMRAALAPPADSLRTAEP
ncbi:site-specific integrase [Intrasporangium calvum]|uniref:Site-specific integrase n=1 Tax=Intrasporangium calvum TaxID=53358 RepID=A0ABT5GFJ5_9MICO|nr:site-specific integrase [Intrasporangium calvum]MDC5696466.1 site-specific integrase [Intrasporangium calvum]